MRQITPFTATATRVCGDEVLVLTGEIDAATGPKFARAVKSLTTGQDQTLVFDMSGVTFMDSTGLTIIASTLQRLAAEGGRLCIRGASPMMCRLFEITGIYESQYLDIVCADDEEATSGASGRRARSVKETARGNAAGRAPGRPPT